MRIRINDFRMSDYVTCKDFLDYPTSIDLQDKEELGKEKVEALIDLVGYWIQRFVDKPLIRQKVKDAVRGSGTDKIFLTFCPEQLIEVREVHSADAQNILSLSLFALNKNLYSLQWEGGYFYATCLYEVTYMAGEIIFLDKLKHAVCLTVEDFINRRDYKEMRSLKVDVIQIQFRSRVNPIPDEAKAILQEWVSNPEIF